MLIFKDHLFKPIPIVPSRDNLQAMKNLGAGAIRRLPGAEEHIRFPLPKGLGLPQEAAEKS